MSLLVGKDRPVSLVSPCQRRATGKAGVGGHPDPQSRALTGSSPGREKPMILLTVVGTTYADVIEEVMNQSKSKSVGPDGKICGPAAQACLDGVTSKSKTSSRLAKKPTGSKWCRLGWWDLKNR